jgi:hypothetical protein
VHTGSHWHSPCVHSNRLVAPEKHLESTGSNILFLEQRGDNTVAGNQAFFQRTNSVPTLPRITTFQFALIPSLFPSGPILSLVQLSATLNVSYVGNTPLERHPALQGRNSDNHASQSRLFAIFSPEEAASVPTTTQLALITAPDSPAILPPDAATPASPASSHFAVGLLSVLLGWGAILLG